MRLAVISSAAFLIALAVALAITSPGIIQLLEPEQGTLLSAEPVFRFTSNVNVSNCSLFINGSIAGTVADVLENSVQNLSVSPITQGEHDWYVACSSNQTISSETRSFSFDSITPIITIRSPAQGAVLNEGELNITLELSEGADCRLDSRNRSFETMSKTFRGSSMLRYLKLVDVDDGDYVYYIKCVDSAQNIAAKKIEFTVESPLKGEVIIDTNKDAEEHYFLPKGRKTLEFKTSRSLEDAPTLYYQFEDGTKHDVALTGSGKRWNGYVIIDPKVNDKVAVFSASYDNEAVEIVDGKMFVVDSQDPSTPSSLKGLDKGENGVALEWYYTGEEVDTFRVYRSTIEAISYLDLLTETGNTMCIDTSAEPGITYYYKVSAVDLAGNEGSLSPLLKLTPGLLEDGPKKVNPKVVAKLNITLKLLAELELDLTTAKQNLAGVSELKTKGIVEEFGLSGVIDGKLKELAEKRKGIEESFAKEEGVVDTRIEDVARFEKEAKASVANGISFEGATEKSQSFAEQDARLVAQDFLKQTNQVLSDKGFRAYFAEVLGLNSQIQVKNMVEVYKLKMLDDSEKQITKITKVLGYTGVDTVQNVRLVEYVPKEIVQSTQDMKISTLGFEVLKQDPMIAWSFGELGFSEREVVYYLKQGVELGKLDSLVTLYMPSPPESESTGSTPTGYVVQDDSQGLTVNASKLALSILTLAIVSLSLYYFMGVRGGGGRREDFSLGGLGKQEKDLNGLIRQGHALIDGLNYSPSRHLYVYMTELLKTEIGTKGLTQVQRKGLQELHTKLKLFRSIATAQQLLEEKNHSELSKLLEQLGPSMLQLKLTQKDSKLQSYLQHWYYHYVNIIDYSGKK